MARTVLITGASGGLGGAVVAAFEAGRWTVATASRSDGYDLAVAADAARAVELAGSRLDAVAHLVGGFAAEQPVASTDLDAVEAMWRLNVATAYQVVHAALPRLSPDGAVVLVSSRAAVAPFAGAAGYAMAKAAVIALAQTVAAEGVRCNAVVPRVIDDPAALADVIVWLCSPESRAVSGAALPV